MRLADTIARRRIVYPRPLPTLPDIVLLDLPPRFRSPSLPLGRYYPAIIETEGEWMEWNDFLRADRLSPVAPDLLDRRPSAMTSPQIAFAHYDPTAQGWPSILLCRWPDDHVAIAGDKADLFARSAYTIEIAPDPGSRATTQAELLRLLNRDHERDIVFVPPSPVIGTS